MSIELAKWKNGTAQHQIKPVQVEKVEVVESVSPVAVYAESPSDINFITLQNNLENCLSIVDNEVMKNYVPALQNCPVVPLDDVTLSELE